MRRSIQAATGCAMLLACAGTAHAQSVSSDKLSVNVNLGYQTQSQDLASSGAFSLYGEDGTFTTTQSIDAGLLFDASVDYRLTKSMAVGIGWTSFSGKSNATVAAQVPHPIFFGQFRTASVGANDIEHHANAINIDAVFRYPLSRKMDVVVSAGPSIVMVNQELTTGITVQQETGPSFSQPTISSVNVTAQKKTTLGFNAGADFAYMVNRRYGAGAGIRYTFASADIDGLADKLKAGGFQVLFGARLRF